MQVETIMPKVLKGGRSVYGRDVGKVSQILADNVRRLRDERAWTQEGLAERAGLSSQAIMQVETQRRWPEKLTIEKLAAAFGCEESDLFADVGRNPVILPGKTAIFRRYVEPYEIGALLAHEAPSSPLITSGRNLSREDRYKLYQQQFPIWLKSQQDAAASKFAEAVIILRVKDEHAGDVTFPPGSVVSE